MLSFLNALPLFGEIPSATLAPLLEKGLIRHCRYGEGEEIGTAKGAELGILLSGEAFIFSADNGRSVILRTLKSGAVFGAASLFCREHAPLSLIRAGHACEVLLFSREAVSTLLESNRTFLYRYITLLSERVEFLNRKIRCFTAGSAERRLALWLLGEEENEVLLPASLSAFAEMLDIGRASLYRAFEKLEAGGLLKKDGRRILLLDKPKMLELYNYEKEI